MPPPPRVAICGIHIESGTFSPLVSTLADFHATRGADLLARYPFLATPGGPDIVPLPLVHFRAMPGGPVAAADYQAMKREIIERLAAAGPIDALYLDVHGAMTVQGLDDAELDLLLALRRRMPPGTPVTCSQDLHGNVSPAFAAAADFLTAYRTAPHTDWMETRRRALDLLCRWWRAPVALHRAHVAVPVLVSGEMSGTEFEPGRSLYASLEEEIRRPGVWDASLWVGYAWADQPRAMATAFALGDDAPQVAAAAEAIAARYWDAREAFRIEAPHGTAAWCVDRALEAGGPANFISDAGDNPTAGAAGDVTHTLAVLLRHPAIASGASTAIFASIPDEAAVAACFNAGHHAPVAVAIGGRLDPTHGPPLPVEGTVRALAAEPHPLGGRRAVLACGGVRVILTERRMPFHRRGDFLALGLDPLGHTLTCVKIGYLEPELKAMARRHFLALSPGGVPPLVDAIPYQRLQRPIHPLDQGFAWKPAAILSSTPARTGPPAPGS